MYLNKFEEQIRASFQLLERRCKTLNEIPKSSKFKICLVTTDSAFLKICNESQFQDFIWLRDLKEFKQKESHLIPISSTQEYGLDCFVEVFVIETNSANS